MRIHNTFRAHQLLHWAKGMQLQTELQLALFRAYFSRGENVNDIDVLVDAATEVGLPGDEARLVIEEERYAAAVRNAEQQWRDKDIRGVPAIIFNSGYAVLGAQGVEAYTRVLRRLQGQP
jgi:predicted DsbA family dithiol-disulfide isomerase